MLTLCHPSLLFVKLVRAKFYFVTIFTLSLIIMLGHAWSRMFTLGRAFSRLLCLCKFLLARSIFLTLVHALSRSITVGHAWSRIFILGNSWPLFLAIVTQVQVFSLMVTGTLVPLRGSCYHCHEWPIFHTKSPILKIYSPFNTVDKAWSSFVTLLQSR
jgi:hypothetical protein